MLAAGTRIVDLDGSVTAQRAHGLPAPATIVDCTDLGPQARLWANAAHCDQIRQRLRREDRHRPTLVGSGDFHYVSALLIEQFTTPLTVIVFDHHPDWERLPPRYGCGAWVNRALELPAVQQVLHVGAGSSDLSFPATLTGNRTAVRDGRLRLLTGADLGSDPNAVFGAALASVGTREIYVSIDKDCLRRAFALTNWEEGTLDLDFVATCLRAIRRTHDLVGLDITGEYSPVEIASPWKRWCAWFDHPRNCTASGRGRDEIARISTRTNLALLAAAAD